MAAKSYKGEWNQQLRKTQANIDAEAARLAAHGSLTSGELLREEFNQAMNAGNMKISALGEKAGIGGFSPADTVHTERELRDELSRSGLSSGDKSSNASLNDDFDDKQAFDGPTGEDAPNNVDNEQGISSSQADKEQDAEDNGGPVNSINLAGNDGEDMSDASQEVGSAEGSDTEANMSRTYEIEVPDEEARRKGRYLMHVADVGMRTIEEAQAVVDKHAHAREKQVSTINRSQAMLKGKSISGGTKSRLASKTGVLTKDVLSSTQQSVLCEMSIVLSKAAVERARKMAQALLKATKTKQKQANTKKKLQKNGSSSKSRRNQSDKNKQHGKDKQFDRNSRFALEKDGKKLNEQSLSKQTAETPKAETPKAERRLPNVKVKTQAELAKEEAEFMAALPHSMTKFFGM